MLQRIFLILLFCGSFSLQGQEKVAQFVNTLKTTNSYIKDVFSVVDEKNGDITLFLSDAKNIYVYQLDSTFTVTRKMTSESKRRKYNAILGVTVLGDTYRLYLTNDLRNRYITMDVSLDAQTTVSKEFKLQYAFERLIQTIQTENTFYLITTSNKNKGLYVYTFDEDGTPMPKEVDLSNISILTNKGKDKPITDILSSSPVVKKMDNLDPVSVDNAAATVKMYTSPNSFILTFDNHKSFTQVLTIDLSFLKASYKTFDKPMKDVKGVNTNSYLKDNKLFTIGGTKEKMQVQVLDFSNGELIKELNIVKDAPIEFSNTPMMQDKNYADSFKELKSTEKFLKRISKGAIGIAVFKRNNRYEVTLGASDDIIIASNGFEMTPGTGVPISGTPSVTFFYNPSHYIYSEYAKSESTRVICLFDEDLNHIAGKIEENAFDKMQKTAPDISRRSITIFRYKDYYLRGFYNYASKGYSLKKFTN